MCALKPGVQELLDRFLIGLGDGAGQPCGAAVTAADVILVADIDKVPDDAPCSDVLVYWLGRRWSAAARGLAASLHALRVDGLSFCSAVARASLVRIWHTEECTAAASQLRATLAEALTATDALAEKIRRRSPGSFAFVVGTEAPCLAAAFKQASTMLHEALAAIDAGDADGAWPCQREEALAALLSVKVRNAADSLIGAAQAIDKLFDGPDAYPEMLSTARVVFCTLSVAGSYLVRNMPPVSYLVVDEAAQATEPEVLIPFTCMPRGMLLAGDPNQLSCMCTSARARAMGLERSCMQRLMELGHARLYFLETQYRMHPSICRFPSARFYDGRLRAPRAHTSICLHG